MIEPISCSCGRKSMVNFTGGADNNFKGITSSMPEAQQLSTREAYNQTVNAVEKTQKDFAAPKGVGENLNITA